MQNDAEKRKQAIEEENRRIEQVLSHTRRKYIVMSGKGGVGKTTVAVNLAVALSQEGYRVGLMDADFHGPDTLRMLGLEGATARSDGHSIMPLYYGKSLQVVSISSMLKSSDAAVIWRGPLKTKAIRQLIANVAWEQPDYFVVDSPPGTGDEPLTVAGLISGTEAVIVTTPQAVSIMDIRRSITFCREVGMPVVGVVENMSGFICPHCHKRIDLFGCGGGEEAAREMSVPFLGRIPLDPRMVEAGDCGSPYVLYGGDSDAARSLSAIASELAS